MNEVKIVPNIALQQQIQSIFGWKHILISIFVYIFNSWDFSGYMQVELQ